MPVVETKIQHEYIMKFLCRREEEGGLGYRETDPNIVSPDLFIPSQLTEFVQEANPIVWKSRSGISSGHMAWHHAIGSRCY